MDPRMYTDPEFRKAAERCAECQEREDCEPFKNMMRGGSVLHNCPHGRANLI